ncbi:MAG: 2-succinyl-5-enolpyruvyl-6-hydroxy-3-cyclohexene-1-carboxylic-acid synthase [Cyclobacteriaceae bacterium]
MLEPVVYNTSEICWANGVRHVVLSPGSRNAPLTISFARNDKVEKWVIPDERTAGFIALGIAQKLQQPVVLCCTSGTALLNYSPAIAEAFYREIPLIVLSADRPPELVDQRDGQTIRQFEALRNHVKVSMQLPIVKEVEDQEVYEKGLIDAVRLSQKLPKGPVHLNIPFREPFYPSVGQELIFSNTPGWEPEALESTEVEFPNQKDFIGKKVLILIGQSNLDPTLAKALGKYKTSVPVLKSPLSNLDVRGIRHVDFFLQDQIGLKPDVLITAGLSVLSKKLKNYLRSHKPSEHFHFDPSGVPVDTYETNPTTIKASLSTFLSAIDFASDPHYFHVWKELSESTSKAIESVIRTLKYCETTAFHLVLKTLPNDVELHLGNSMPVRFSELFNIPYSLNTWSNRGTSGIDGCTSTALGTSLVSQQLNVLITGDVSFLYDRNAFFHSYNTANLRVIVFNNQGGGIFRLIDGPKSLPELEKYFETRHNRTAEYICAENKISYIPVMNSEELVQNLKDFYRPSQTPKLLEIFTDPSTNENVFKKLKKHIHEQINL